MTRQPYGGERLGNLRERVTLEKRTVTLDDFGQPIITWVPLGTVWARVEPLKGGERFAAQQIVADLAYRVHIRYRTDVSVLDRVVWQGQHLDVNAITNPDERERYTILDCEADQ